MSSDYTADREAKLEREEVTETAKKLQTRRDAADGRHKEGGEQARLERSNKRAQQCIDSHPEGREVMTDGWP